MESTGEGLDSFKITTLLNNSMNNLNLGQPEEAIKNIDEIRKLLSKFSIFQKVQNTNFDSRQWVVQQY